MSFLESIRKSIFGYLFFLQQEYSTVRYQFSSSVVPVIALSFHPSRSYQRKVPKYINAKVKTRLCEIMKKRGSDKGLGWHSYTIFYSALFSDVTETVRNVFELGLGTNDVTVPSNMGANGTPGASLRGWRDYFPNANIYGADIDRNILFKEKRIKTYYCDQTNPDSIKKMWGQKELPKQFDFIIDDGLHEYGANICFFENSIQKLGIGGIYIVEDIPRKDLERWKVRIKTKYRKKHPNFEFSYVRLPNPKNSIDNNLVIVERIL